MMKKVFGYKESLSSRFKEYLVKKEGFLGLNEFCIYNVGETIVEICINDGNVFELETNESFDCKTTVYHMRAKGDKGIIKYTGIEV